MEPIGIFILAMICQVYSCASNVSDSVERIQYASVAGEEYLLEDKLLLEQYLPEIKKAKIVRLEGHCDERGTREYNLALGERRALEVRDFLVVKGVSGKKIRVVSFGEEKPLKSASNEKAWAENRRVEISLY